MPLRLLTLSFVLAGALAAAPSEAAPAPPGDGYVAYFGTATARDSAKVLYEEHHVLHYQGGRLTERVVLYTCKNGAPFARKTVAYVDPIAPNFDLADATNGMHEGIRGEAPARVVFYGSSTEPEKSAPLPAVSGLVADAGFDDYLLLHWDELIAGHSLKMAFLLPSRLADYTFQVQRLRDDRIDGVPVDVFRLKVSGVLGWVLPAIDVAYGSADRLLMRFDGLSDLRDKSNNNLLAIINFHAADRHPSDEQAMASARQAHLAPCP
jgi:hypothetical protein